MEPILDFVKSDVGVAIAWLCTVGSTIFAIVTAKENRTLKVRIHKSVNNATTDNSKDTISQTGDKNVYTKNNSGGMNIKM